MIFFNFLVLLLLVVGGSCKCTVSYTYQALCEHYPDDCDDPDQCEPVRTSYHNAHCPVFYCVSQSDQSLKNLS